jgi:hypothetical protein
MKERNSRKVLNVYRYKLVEILNECTKINSMQNRALPDRDNTGEDVWQKEVDTRTNECFTLIEAHLESHIDETSTKASVSTRDQNPTFSNSDTRTKQQISMEKLPNFQYLYIQRIPKNVHPFMAFLPFIMKI